MYGLKSHSYDMVIDVIPLEKQFELLELYDTIEDYMLLAQITGIDSLHIKLILHRRRIILNRRGRPPGKYMDAADLILLEWVKHNIRTEADISKKKIYEQIEHLKALLDIPCYHVRKQTWLQINSVICDNLQITDSKENFKLNIYSIIKSCGEYILEPNAYRKFIYSVEQNTFFRRKEEVTNTEFDKTEQSVLSKDIENPEQIIDQSVTTSNLVSIEKPVIHIDASNVDDDTNKTESKSDLSSKLNNESMRMSSLALEESEARFARSPDVSPIEKPVIEIDIIDEDVVDNTEIERDSSSNLNDESMKKSATSLEESEEQVLASPDLILIEKPIVQIDISNDDEENNKEMKNKSNHKLNAECKSIKGSSPSLDEMKEEEALNSPDLILIEKPIVHIDISNDDEENNKEMKNKSNDKLNAECTSIKRSSPSLKERKEEEALTSPDLILIEKPIVQIDISNDDEENNKEMKNKSNDKLNAECTSIKGSSPSLKERKEEEALTSPDLILIEKPIVQIDISNDDEENNKEMKNKSNDKLNAECTSIKRSSPSLKERKEEEALNSPDLILIEKPIVHIDISNDDEENNKEIKNKSNDKLNAECTSIKGSSPSLEDRKEEVLTSPDLILIEKPIVQIDISNDDEDNNKVMKSNSNIKFNAECITRSSSSLPHMQESVSTSPDLILIEKPIVQIDISNDDEGNNAAIKNDSTFLSPMEQNPKILRIKLGKRHHQPLDFKDSNPVPVKKEREKQNKQTTRKDILNISKCNNDCQSNGSALDILNTPVVDMKRNLQPNSRETKTTSAKESNGPVLIAKGPEGLDNFEEFLDISQHNDDCKLNGSSALDIIDTSLVDVKQDIENCNLQLKREVTKAKSAKGNVERVNCKVSHSVPVNKKSVELKVSNNESSSNNFNTQLANIQKGCTRLQQNITESGEFSTTNHETQRDESLVQEAKPKSSMDYISQTVKKEYDNEIQKENVKSNETIQEVKSTETQNKDNNIDNEENGDEDNIEIVFEIEDDDGNVQIELLKINELVAKQLMEN